jgi:hypothetical protein
MTTRFYTHQFMQDVIDRYLAIPEVERLPIEEWIAQQLKLYAAKVRTDWDNALEAERAERLVGRLIGSVDGDQRAKAYVEAREDAAARRRRWRVKASMVRF